MTAMDIIASKSDRPYLKKPTRAGAPSSVYKQFLAQARHLGFDSGYVEMLMAADCSGDNIDNLWIDFIEHILDVTDLQPAFADHYRHMAITGDIASGKSTILAQLACNILQGNKTDEIIFALCENASGAVNELLICLARIIGCPVLYIRSAQELLHELETVGRHRRFLIDLPAKPSEQLAYLEYLKNTQKQNPVGILCALARRGELLASKDAMQLWLKFSHGWALSFAGEQTPIGHTLSIACKSPRPLAYIGKSHDFLEGLLPASSAQLKSLIMSSITRLNQGPSRHNLVM